MKIKILAAGRLKDKALLSLIEGYQKRCTWKIDFQEFEAKSQSEEAQTYLKLLDSDSTVIALDERGQSWTSEEMASRIEDCLAHGSGKLTFIIGGAYGLTEEVRKRAKYLISFGKQTWPHMLVRLMLVEQLYRAELILRNHPYHKS